MRTYGRSWSLWMAWLVVMCLTEHALAADSLSVGIVTVTGLDYSSYLADQTSGVVAEMENDAALKQLLAFPYSSTSTTVSEDNATSDIEEWVRTTPVSFIEGGIPFNMTNFSSTLVVDPINATTGLHMQSTNIIYLFPTLVQQLYVCAFYCSEHDISTTHLRLLLRDDSDGVDAITAAAKVAFSFYGLSLPSSSVVVSGATISDELLTSGTTFVVGLTTADVAPLVTFLEAHSDATVIVDFDDLTVLYDTFVTSFGTEYKSAMSRLLYTTNLPRWSEAGVPTDVLMELHARAYAEDESAPFETPTMALTGATAHYSDAMSIFYANMPATYRTPAGLRAFVTALVAGLTSLEAKKLTSAGISKAFFSTKTVEIDDMIFGPYTTGCTGPSQNPSSCIVNYGATKLWLWPYSSIYDKDVSPATSRALTPPLGDGSGGFQAHNYGTGARGTFTDNYVLWIILAIIALMLLLLLILLIMCCCCPCACCPCGRSSSSTQEKEAEEQDMTIVVVSVADRGWLWYHEPESMKGAVDELQRLVQRVARGERCHLSRSSGETFVVRSKTAEDALRFGQRIQTEVRSHHSHDVSAICHAAQEEGADEPLQGRACYAAGYLPVRVGMHSGHCERTPDAEEVQETDLEPCAAATSGLGRGGGQVLMTEATHRMLPSSADKNYHIEFFGEHAVGNNDTPQRIFILKEDKPEREVAQERSTAVRQVEEERVREARGEANRVMDAPRVVESTEPQERFAEGQASRALPIANTGVEEEEDDEWQEAEGQTSRVMYSDSVQQEEEEEEVVLEERAVCVSPEDEKEEEEALVDRLSAYTEEPPRSVYEDDAPIKLPPPVITCSVGTQVEDNWHRSPREEEGEQSYSPMEGCLVPIPAPILAPRPERCERSAYTYPDKSHVDSIYPSTDNRSSYDRRWNQEASTMYRSSYYDGPHRPEESWSRDLPERRPRSPLPPPSPSKPPQLRGWDAYHVEEWE